MRENTSYLYRFIKWLVRLLYPRMEVLGTENLPDEPVIYVANHAQLHGPIACELYLPGKHCTWCAGQMMHLKEVPGYAYQDFWSQKPRALRPFFHLAAYLIAPLSVVIFNNANTIAVYHDSRILTTFRQSIQYLQQGFSMVIFPEHDVPHNQILCQFQDRFIDIARLYYKRTGKEITFVPLYIAPNLSKMVIGKGTRFQSQQPIDQERQRTAGTMMESITKIACSLPEHTVVPYRNIPKSRYPLNTPKEPIHEKSCC